MTGPVVIPEAIVYPPGVDLENPSPDVSWFRIFIKHRGRGRYCITRDRDCQEQMTHTGKWIQFPLRMTQMRWCRFTYEQALALAVQHAPAIALHGLTWAEWEQFDHMMTPDARALIRERYQQRTLI